MILYFFVLELALFRDVLGPSLTRGYRQKSFALCQDLCQLLLARNPGIPKDALIRAVLVGLPFDRTLWHGLIGECLIHGAVDIPRLQTAPETVCCLLAPDHYGKPDTPRAG